MFLRFNYITKDLSSRLGLLLLLFILSLSHTQPCKAADSTAQQLQDINQKLNQLQSDLKINKDAVWEVRRDELNYRLEKNLLKEAYSSKLQIVNFVITIALIILTIVGIFGIKSLNTIKKEFKDEFDKLKDKYEGKLNKIEVEQSIVKKNFHDELDKLKNMGEEYEGKFNKLVAEQNIAKETFDELLKQNEKQDQRLKIIEIQEKAAFAWKSKEYERGIEYCDVGLSLESKNTTLLWEKMRCLNKLDEITKAIAVGENILSINPNDITVICNLVEFYLIDRNISKYEQIINLHADAILEYENAYILWYFDQIKNYNNEDITSIKQNISSKIILDSRGASERIDDWEYENMKFAISNDENTPEGILLLLCIDFLEGEISKDELNGEIKRIE